MLLPVALIDHPWTLPSYLRAVGIDARITHLQVAPAVEKNQKGEAPLYFSNWGSFSVQGVNSKAVGGIVFACVFGGALLGIFLGLVLPKEHLSSESTTVVRMATAMIPLMSAVVVGLLIASAKSSFDIRDAEYRHSAPTLSCSTAPWRIMEPRRRPRAICFDSLPKAGCVRSGPNLREASGCRVRRDGA